jgi:hypothetical protein
MATDALAVLLDAQATIATRDRQRAGAKPCGGGPDVPVTAREAAFAEAVVDLTHTVADLKFEIACLRGTLPPLAPALSEEEFAVAATPGAGIVDAAAEFHGYRDGDYHAFIGDDAPLEAPALADDADACMILALKCNARAREILRLRAARLGIDVPGNEGAEPDVVLALGITGSHYRALLTDARPLAGLAASGDITALSSLGSRCRMRASVVMDEADRARRARQVPDGSEAPENRVALRTPGT